MSSLRKFGTLGGQSAHKVRTGRIAVLVVTALLTAIGTSAAGASKPKSLPQPVCAISQPVVSSNRVHLVGGCRYGKKAVNPNVSWQITGETDASDAPLPVQPSSGTGAIVPVPIQGGYKLNLVVKLSTPKTKAHKAAVKAAPVDVLLDGYTAIGTQVPGVAPYTGSGAPYCEWTGETLNVADSSPTVDLPSLFHCGPTAIMGDCHWQATPPEPPTDALPNRDGVVTTTGLTVYGGEVVCANGYTAVPYLRIDFEYADGQTWADSCELDMRGVTSFTIPPSWKAHFVSFYVDLITYGPDGGYNANQSMQSTYGTRTSGSIDPCQAYHLPAFKP